MIPGIIDITVYLQCTITASLTANRACDGIIIIFRIWLCYTSFNWLLLATFSILWCTLLGFLAFCFSFWRCFVPHSSLHYFFSSSAIRFFFTFYHLCNCFVTRNMQQQVWSSTSCLLARNRFQNHKVLFLPRSQAPSSFRRLQYGKAGEGLLSFLTWVTSG